MLEGIYVVRILEGKKATGLDVFVCAGRAVVAVVAVGETWMNPDDLRNWLGSHGRMLEREKHDGMRIVAKNVLWRVAGLKLGDGNLLERLWQLQPHGLSLFAVEAVAIPDQRIDTCCVAPEPLNCHMPSNAGVKRRRSRPP